LRALLAEKHIKLVMAQGPVRDAKD